MTGRKESFRRALGAGLLIGWGLLALVQIPRAAPYLNRLPALLNLLATDPWAKAEFLEGELGQAARLCEKEVPPTEPLLFYAEQTVELEETLHKPAFYHAHDRQKIAYLLYPRPVYWNPSSLPRPVRYVLVYHAHVEVSGFTLQSRLSDDIYLLKRGEAP